MTDLGPIKHYLGMEVIRNRENHTLILNQTQYLTQVLKRFNMHNSKQVYVLIDPSLTL